MFATLLGRCFFEFPEGLGELCGRKTNNPSMKRYTILFALCALSTLGIRAELTDTATIDNDCHRMVQFFKATLYENYGDSLAFDTFINAYRAYDDNYILQVDRDKLKVLFAEIYERTWRDYLLGGHDESQSRYKLNPKWEVRWVQYSPGLRTQSINPHTEGSYLHRVIARSERPYFKMVYEHAQKAWGFSSYHVNDFWINHDWLAEAFRDGDEEVQLWLTFMFLPYLCHCSNIDVYCGKPKEEVPDTFIMREFKLPPL